MFLPYILFASLASIAFSAEPIPNSVPAPSPVVADTESPNGDKDMDSPVDIPYVVDSTMTVGVPWTPPNFSNQDTALGWKNDVFVVPESLKRRVDFWTDVYAKYGSDQGILHDTDYLDVIYEPVDFTEIMNDPNIPEKQKNKARREVLKKKKADIKDRLMRLSKLTSSEGLTGEDLRYWKMFENITEKKKFVEATSRKRLRFQLGQRDYFKKGIYYSGRYLKRMEEIFSAEGLPIELTRLPFVESSFNIYARSKVGASGIWQFMRYTAKLYMKVGSTVDERNDPLIATRGAARLLKFNHKLLGHWPLALTAYNHGPAGVAKIVKALGTTDLNEIIERESARRFGFASANFYACFLAALHIETNAEKYFGPLKRAPEIKFEELKTEKAISFAALTDAFKGDVELTDLYNAHLSRRLRLSGRKIPSGTLLRIPAGSLKAFSEAMTKVASTKEVELIPGKTKYEVSAGDTLSGIASDFGIKMNDLMEMNDIDDPRKLRPGKVLLIPEAKIR